MAMLFVIYFLTIESGLQTTLNIMSDDKTSWLAVHCLPEAWLYPCMINTA